MLSGYVVTVSVDIDAPPMAEGHRGGSEFCLRREELTLPLPLSGGVHGHLGGAFADGADVTVHPGGVAEGVGGVAPVLVLLVGFASHLAEVVKGVAVVVHALFPGVLDEDGGGGFLEVPLVLPAVWAKEAIRGELAGLRGGAASAPGVG